MVVQINKNSIFCFLSFLLQVENPQPTSSMFVDEESNCEMEINILMDFKLFYHHFGNKSYCG